jgi:hypothetical protein
MFIPCPRRIEALCVAWLLGTCLPGDAAEWRVAPHPAAAPVNQLAVSGNACGPAALLASFRCGSEAWQRAAASLPGSTDRDQLGQWIRRHGLRPSSTLKGRTRWSAKGINVEDLVDATNEMNRPLFLPALAHDDLFLRRGEKPEALLKRTRDRFDRSLAKGIPPLLSLRRFVLRDGNWTPLQGHFVTVTGVPRKLGKGETSFAIRYLDPWGGKRCEGRLGVPGTPVLALAGQTSPCLEALVPAAIIGKSEVRRGETSVVVPAAVIGRW